jgi:hypothetical protein
MPAYDKPLESDHAVIGLTAKWINRLLSHGAAWWIAALLPIGIAAALVAPCWVDVPVWDDWERGPLLKKWTEGSLTLSDLTAAHIQHRNAIARLVTLALNGPTNGDIRWELAVIFLVTAGTALGVAGLARQTLQPRAAPILAFVITALLMSPWQYQTYFWAGTLGLVLPGLFVVLALLAWTRLQRTTLRFAIVGVLSVACSLCFAHGLLIWPTLAALMWLSIDRRRLRIEVTLAGAYTLAGALSIAFYLKDLHNTSHPVHAYGGDAHIADQVGMAGFRANPLLYLSFGMRMLGSPVARGIDFHAESLSLVMGGILVVAFLTLAALVLFRWTDSEMRIKMLPWIALGSFSIVSAAAVTWGRAGFSSDMRALCPRYIALVHYLPATLLVVFPFLFRKERSHRSFAALGNSAIGICIAWLFILWTSALDPLIAWHQARLSAKAELSLLPVVQRSQNTLLDGASDFLLEQAEFLDSKGWLHPPMSREPWLDQYRIRDGEVAKSRGEVTQHERREDGTFLRGHASFPRSGRAADAVLICTMENNRLRIIAIADPAHRPNGRHLHVNYEFTTRHHPSDKLHYEWEVLLPPNVYDPNSASTLSVWKLDFAKRQVHRINSGVLLQRSPEEP